MVNSAGRRHRAAVLLIVASVLWWHRWIPALLLAGFVSWVILHRRLEGHLGDVLGRVWRRAWPPPTAVLVLVLSGGTLAYWIADEAITPKVLPIALNMLALSMIVVGLSRSLRVDTMDELASGRLSLHHSKDELRLGQPVKQE